MSGARIFDFTGALPHMLDQLPVAPGAGPFDLGWRSGCLFVTATPLMKNAGRGAIEGFVTKFTTEVGFGGSVVREFMDASEFASGAWFFANAAWVVVKVMFLLGLGGAVQEVSCLAYLRASRKILPHLRQVSAFALVSAFCFGAAQRRECVVMRKLRPLLARSPALSLPSVFECPLTHLSESGWDRLT